MGKQRSDDRQAADKSQPTRELTAKAQRAAGQEARRARATQQARTQQHAAYTDLTYAQPPHPPSPTNLHTLKKRETGESEESEVQVDERAR